MRRILECVGLPARAPPVAPIPSMDESSRREPEIDVCSDFDQTPQDDDI